MISVPYDLKNLQVGCLFEIPSAFDSSDGRLFNNSEETIVNGKLTYRGSNKSDSKTLEIGNQGGTAVIRFSNSELGKYDLSQEQQVEYT